MDPFVDLVVETTLVSHNTGVAIVGAAAAAAGAGVDGADPARPCRRSCRLAQLQPA